jgi:UDP-N-acetylglucosamine 2-epimerase (non-hydrolysing)
MKIVSIVGARPQFIKCAPLSREIRKRHQEIIVHTGQHYDPEMSEIFFEELDIPKPGYHLGVGSGSHAGQTAKILERTETVLLSEHPDIVVIYGDTNSTLAGALAASKLQIPIAHVEAGLRSFDRTMPEEINRVVADHLSSFLFCPTTTAVSNLHLEGISKGVCLVGDVMNDALFFNRQVAETRSDILDRLGITRSRYLVLTVHRPSNTDNKNHLAEILRSVSKAGLPVVFPVHPRTRKNLDKYGLLDCLPENLLCIDPVGYLDMISLMAHADKILTDSGGVQKEAYLLGIPCITLRENTEWIETVADGWNILVGADSGKIISAIESFSPDTPQRDVFGPPGASKRICEILDCIISD